MWHFDHRPVSIWSLLLFAVLVAFVEGGALILMRALLP
jgi:hypothetical protein